MGDDSAREASPGEENPNLEIPLYCRFLQPADPIYLDSEGFDPNTVPPTSLMLMLNQSGTWYHEDPYERPPQDRRCLCRELNESFIWVDTDPEMSSDEEEGPDDEEEMMAQMAAAAAQEDYPIRRAVSF